MYLGHYDSSDGILVEFEKDGRLYANHYQFEPVEVFVKSFKGYFEDEIVGVVRIETDSSTSTDIEYYIDDVPISTLVKEAEVMQVKIIKKRVE